MRELTRPSGGTVDHQRPAGRPGQRWRRLRTSADAWPLLVLIVVPLVVFVIPALAGHPAIAGDNTIQNFPLRVQAGRALRSGHLPLWNPLLWSGTPLLGGMNAGALYPFTLLWTVCSPIVGWVLNLLAVYWAGGIGCYLLLRHYALRPRASLLAALTFTFAGTMSSQMVHLGVVQGMGLMPLLVLAMHRVAESALGGDRRGGWTWTTVLAVLVGMVGLTGEPRSIAEAQLVASVVALWLVLRPYRPAVAVARRLWLAGYLVVGALWGVLLGAVQLLPGESFINLSQRASESYQFFGSGSLRPSWTVLMLVPNLFGGDGAFGEHNFFNTYNLPEVTGYVGLLPLAAVVAFAWRLLRRRRDRDRAVWGMWFLLFVVGLVATWGNFTPLGHLFAEIPLFGRTRLQSRNLEIVDLAAVVLFGFWADRALGPRPGEAELEGRSRWLTALPPMAAAVCCVVAIVIPGTLEHFYGVPGDATALGRGMTPYLLVQLAVALSCTALVLGWRLLSVPRRFLWLTVVVVADVSVFVAFCSTGLTQGNVTLEPTTRAATAVLGHGGRFAIFDTTAENLALLTAVGQPDLNAFTGLASVQGYGSLVDDHYGTVTGSHTLDDLDPCAVADGAFAPLRLGSVLVLDQFLAPSKSEDGRGTPTVCPGTPPPGTPTRRTWYLGTVRPVTSIDLEPVTSGASPPALRRVGLLQADGRVFWPRTRTAADSAGGWQVALPRAVPAVGVVVEGAARSFSDTSTVTASGGSTYELNGAMQDAMGLVQWHYTRTYQQFSRFRSRTLRPPVWLGRRTPGASVYQVRTDPQGGEVDRVSSSRPVTVVRSESALPGWKVTAVPAGGGPSRSLAVEPLGLVQSTRVPAGSWTLTFSYHPPGLEAGLVATGAGLLGLVVAAAWWVVDRRRRRLGRDVVGGSPGAAR